MKNAKLFRPEIQELTQLSDSGSFQTGLEAAIITILTDNFSQEDREQSSWSAPGLAHRVAGIIYASLGRLPKDPYQLWAAQFLLKRNLLDMLMQGVATLERTRPVVQKSNEV